MGVDRLPAVVCDDRPAVVASLSHLLRAAGFALEATTVDMPSLTAAVRTSGARVAVVALPLVGMSGLAAVSALREAAPWCDVLVLEAPGALAVASVEAGARAAATDDDLRALRAVLREIAAEPARVVLPQARRPQSDEAATVGSVSTNPAS